MEVVSHPSLDVLKLVKDSNGFRIALGFAYEWVICDVNVHEIDNYCLGAAVIVYCKLVSLVEERLLAMFVYALYLSLVHLTLIQCKVNWIHLIEYHHPHQAAYQSHMTVP